MNARRAGRRLLKVLVTIAAGVLALSLLIVVVVSLPPVQKYARERTEQLLDSLLVGDITLQGIRTNLFSAVTVDKVVLRAEGDDADSIVAYDVRAAYSLLPLLRKTVMIHSIDVGRVVAYLSRPAEGPMIPPFLPRAVLEERERPPPEEPEPSGWRVRIESMSVDKIDALYRDRALDLTARVPAGSFRGSLPAVDSIILKADLPWASVRSPWWSGEFDTLRAEATIIDSAVLVDTLVAFTDGLTALGAGRIPFDTAGAWDMAVQAFADVSEWAYLRNRVPGLAESGALAADVAMTGTLREPLISLDVAGSGLAYREYPVDSVHLTARYDSESDLHVRLTAGSPLAEAIVEGQAAIPALLDSPSVRSYTVQASVNNLDVSRIPDLRIGLEPLRTTRVQVRAWASGSGITDIPARIAARATVRGGAFERVPLQVQTSLESTRWRLAADWGENVVEGSGTMVIGGDIGGTVEARVLQPGLITRTFLDRIIRGTLYARADIAGTLDVPRLRLAANSPELRYAGLVADTVSAQATLRKGTFAIRDAHAVIAGPLDTLFGMLGVTDAGGFARVEVNASGTLDEPRVVARVDASRLAYADYSADTVSGRVILAGLDSLIWRGLRVRSGDAVLQSNGALTLGLPWRLGAAVDVASRQTGRWQEAGTVRAWATLGADSLAARFEMNDFGVAVLTEWLPFEQRIAGRLTAQGAIRGTGQELTGDISINMADPGISGVRFPSLTGAIALRETSARADLRLLLHDRESAIDIAARVPLVAGARFEIATGDERPFFVAARGDSLDMAGFEGMLDGQLGAQGGPLSLNAVVRRLDGIWALEGAVDMGSAQFTYEPLSISASGVTFNSTIGGTTARPLVSFRLATGNIRLPSQLIARSRWEGTLRGDTVALTTGFARFQGGGTIRLTGSVPLSEVGELLSGGDPDLQFEFVEVPLDILEQFIPGLRVQSGTLEGSGAVVFRRGEFSSAGALTLENAVFTYEGIETQIGPVAGTIDLTGDTIRLDSLRGTLGDGSFLANGFVVWLPGDQPRISLALTVDKASVTVTDLVTIRIRDADLELVTRDGGYLLRGVVDLGETRVVRDFWVPDLIEIARGPPGAAPEEPGEFARQFALRVEIDIDQNLYIDMNLADVQLDGRLAVSGTLAEPGLVGRIEVVEGDIYYLDRRFEVTTGTVRFLDPFELNPVFSITAVTEVVATTAGSVTQVPGTETYTITLSIAGTLKNPEVVLTSVPPLPQPEIVSVLTLGTTLGAVGGELASRIQTLAANELLGFGAQKLERLLGLEEIRVTGDIFSAEAETGAQVTLTKRVSRRLSVTYGTALREFGEQELSAVYRLTRWLFLVGTVSQRGASTIDVRTRFTW